MKTKNEHKSEKSEFLLKNYYRKVRYKTYGYTAIVKMLTSLLLEPQK